MRIHPATLEELRQEAAEAQEACASLNPSGFDGQQVIAGLRRLRQEIQEIEQAIDFRARNHSAA